MMAQQNVAHVLYAIRNANLNSMPKVVIFMGSMPFPSDAVIRLLVGPTCQWGEGGNPLLPPPRRV
jgi:hypothetical protein